MNAISAKLLEDSIQGTANQFQRDREFTDAKANRERDDAMRRELLENTIKRQGMDDTRQRERDKATAAYRKEQGDNVKERNRITDERYTADQTTKAAKEAMSEKQTLFKAATSLNATGQLDDASREKFNKFLADDEHFGTTGIQLGKPDPKYLKTQGKQPAIKMALDGANEYRQQAADATDEDEATRLNNYADLIESWAKKQGEFATPKPLNDILTEKHPAVVGHPEVPAIPGEKHWYGDKAGVPGQPAVADQPAYNVTRHVPAGQPIGPLTTPPTAPLGSAAPVQPPTLSPLGTNAPPPAPGVAAPSDHGYQVGRIYPHPKLGNMKYLGGNPAVSTSWAPAQ